MTPHDPSARDFWRGRRVFITGHTGFKGAWLWLWLQDPGCASTGYALAPPTVPSLWDIVRAAAHADDASIIADVREPARLRAAVEAADPQVVFHLAAQALVRESYADPLATFATNVLGTAALLEACRDARTPRMRGRRDQRQGLRERRHGTAVRGGRPARRSRSLQREQGRRRDSDAELPRQLFRRGAAHRDGARRQRHRRRRLVGRPVDSRLRPRARGRAAREPALPGCGAALAARSRAPRRLSRARAGAGALARQRAARCQFRAGCGILFDRKGAWSRHSAPASAASRAGSPIALPIRARRGH